MGSYLNPGSTAFQGSLRSQIYIDKSGLIEKTNTVLGTEQKYVCVSRPRRFGKSMAANMLAAYYDRDCDTKEFFDKLKISQSEEYLKHLNQYDVLKINMQEFLSATQGMEEMLRLLQKRLITDLKNRYSSYEIEDNLVFAMQDVYANTHHPFIILIDEWDCLFREYQQDKDAQKKISGFSAFLVERQRLHCSCIHDRDTSDKKIRFSLGIEYVYGVLDDRSGRTRRIFWVYGRRS